MYHVPGGDTLNKSPLTTAMISKGTSSWQLTPTISCRGPGKPCVLCLTRAVQRSSLNMDTHIPIKCSASSSAVLAALQVLRSLLRAALWAAPVAAERRWASGAEGPELEPVPPQQRHIRAMGPCLSRVGTGSTPRGAVSGRSRGRAQVSLSESCQQWCRWHPGPQGPTAMM